ncbi:CLUMA_CG011486, isoform A [Clunio marinus]|uniref:CLUMA_CG011486, isoform A n=1 Tax=Clunio marinus TaxID=568069 RepID=A0A1J1IGE6_9DIPT|nr:CLUMA_CG011486, isoform A [Clunio marinus]
MGNPSDDPSINDPPGGPSGNELINDLSGDEKIRQVLDQIKSLSGNIGRVLKGEKNQVLTRNDIIVWYIDCLRLATSDQHYNNVTDCANTSEPTSLSPIEQLLKVPERRRRVGNKIFKMKICGVMTTSEILASYKKYEEEKENDELKKLERKKAAAEVKKRVLEMKKGDHSGDKKNRGRPKLERRRPL